MTMFDLTGKVAIVTGGNGGIVLSGRNQAKGDKAAAGLGHGAVFIAADVTKKAACAALVEAVTAQFGRLDILINNAGIAIRKPPEALTEVEWHRVMDTNMTSAFLMSQLVYPKMVASGGGKIINIGSVMSLFAASHTAPYASSKGAIMQFTKAIAAAWAKDGIQCNCVLPGWIDTELTAAAREQVAGLNEMILARTSAGRWGKPEDLAGIAVFLASRASDFVTGAAIPCDGGYMARG